ncbi:MAG: putative DUF214 family protein [Streblomastix strix]|uniref:Putative DUF214 family protein n=1 Tax=Streblomastix strix TaxID=222440 RepID=A0A5J4W852_9EUKA|nr:MAG: putative DUF214 family protein [Streblomastix strix]
MVICVVFSIANKFPVIALMYSESWFGQFDLKIQSGGWTQKRGINTTKMDEILSKLDKEYNRFSPRIHIDVDVIKDNGDTDDCSLMIIDSLREKELQIGRDWTYTEEIPKGGVIITQRVANYQNYKIGDKIKFEMNVNDFCAITADIIYKGGFGSSEAGLNAISAILEMLTELEVEFEIVDISYDQMGKSGSRYCIFAEYATFWEYIVDHAIPSDVLSIFPRSQWLLEDNMNQRVKYKSPLYDYALSVVFAYSDPRTDVYVSFNVDDIKKKIIKWSSPIAYALRFDELNIRAELVVSFDEMIFFTVLVELVAIMIITLLSGISILLIYSLLMISTDTRQFELGILRMVGMNRFGIVGVLVTQSLLYSVPGIIFGLILAVVVNLGIMYLIQTLSSIPLSKGLSAVSIITSILISVGISVIASIFPIRHALSQNLHDSVDVQHSKGSSVKVNIERSEKLLKPWSILISGIILTGIGAGVYILLPMSLISGQGSLLAFVLFGLLMMILIGLVMITVNFEFVFERLIAFVFLFWESKAVKFMAVKNLTTHRLRNRKTTLLFSISLSFIVFVNVMASITMSFLIDQSYHSNAGDIRVTVDTGSGWITSGLSTNYSPVAYYIVSPVELEYQIMNRFGDIIETIAWVTPSLEKIYPFPVKTTISNIGRSHQYNHQIYAASSNFMDNIRKQNLNIAQMTEKRKLGKSGNGDDPIRQLYSHRCRQFSTILSSGFRNEIDGQSGEQLILSITPITQSNSLSLSGISQLFGQSNDQSLIDQQQQIELKRQIIYPSTYMKSQPFFFNPPETMSFTSYAEAPLSVPTFLSLLPEGFRDYDDLQWKYMIIRFRKRGKEGLNNNELVMKRNNVNKKIENQNEIDLVEKKNRKTNQKMSQSEREKRMDDLLQYLKSFKFIIIKQSEDEEEQQEEDVIEEEQEEDEDDKKEKNRIKISLGVWSLEEDTKGIRNSTKIIDLSFMAITILVMFFCFFSLMSSMHTNIMEQTREIGIERALGLKRFQLVRIYIEEAFILVFSAAVMGMMVGLVVGYILTSQMGMMQGIPLQFVFPWQMSLVSVFASIIVSFLASVGPAWNVVSSNIVTTMKTT